MDLDGLPLEEDANTENRDKNVDSVSTEDTNKSII